jgi:hypothetical protein
LSALGSTCLLVGGALAGNPPRIVSVVAATDPPAAAPIPVIAPADQETPALLSRLSQLSEFIARNAESNQVYRYQLTQGDVLLQLAVRTKEPPERDRWLRLAVDAYHSAMVSSPDNELAGQQRLIQLRAEIPHSYPGSTAANYAAMQEIQADYLRVLNKNGDKPAEAQLHRCQRLLRLAMEEPKNPDVPKLIMEVARTYEGLKKTEEARRCYRYLADSYPTLAEGRKAGGCLWRMGLTGEPVSMKLPYLYPSPDCSENEYELAMAHGKLVVVYFWSCKCGQVEEDFRYLKQLTDRFQFRGVEVVYVNVDDDPEQARGFLAGRLTSGVHLHQKGGLASPIAERYGLQSLPQAFLVGRDGFLIRHSLNTAQVELEVSAQMPHQFNERAHRR